MTLFQALSDSKNNMCCRKFGKSWKYSKKIEIADNLTIHRSRLFKF